jgi:hypothetical protein
VFGFHLETGASYPSSRLIDAPVGSESNVPRSEAERGKKASPIHCLNPIVRALRQRSILFNVRSWQRCRAGLHYQSPAHRLLFRFSQSNHQHC